MPAKKSNDNKALYDLADEIIAPKKETKKKAIPKIDASEIQKDKIPHLDLLNAELAKRNLYFFLTEFWEEFNSDKLETAPFYEFICKELQFAGKRVINREVKTEDILLNLPPGVGKTSILISFAAWLIANDPSLAILYASYSHDLAQQKSEKIKMIFTSEKFQRYFPKVSIKTSSDRKDRFELVGGGVIAVASPQSMVLGTHYDLLLCDDLQDARKANSHTERQNIKNWIDNTLSTRKKNKAVTLLVNCQQRLRSDDVTEHLLSKGKSYLHICLPAEYNANIVKPSTASRLYKQALLDPKRLSPSILEGLKIDLGLVTYQSQINQNPSDKRQAIIQEEWMTTIKNDDWHNLIEGRKLIYNFYIDGAYTNVTTNDPSAIVATVKIGETLYITGISQVWKEFSELTRHIYSWCLGQGMSPQSKIIIEGKGPGLSLISALKQDYPVNAIASPTPKGTKKERLSDISGIVEAKRVIMREGSWNSKLMEEITTNDNPRDDIQDAFCMSVNHNLVTGRQARVLDIRSIDFRNRDKKLERFRD